MNNSGSVEKENHRVGINMLPLMKVINKSSHFIKAAIVAIKLKNTKTATLMNINLINIPPDLN